MIRQDYIMRQIEGIARMLAKILFNKDSTSYIEEQQQAETDQLYHTLNDLVDKGQINQAEDLLFEHMNLGDSRYMELALDFYARLNALDEKTLDDAGFEREEIKQGLLDAAKRYGFAFDESLGIDVFQ